MKKTIYIICDTKHNPEIQVGYMDEEEPNPVQDMGILCEAIVTLIRATKEIRPEWQSVEDCIAHLKSGFVDDTFKAEMKGKEKKKKKIDLIYPETI